MTVPATERPRISVVLPTYERRELVVAAVRALAGQSFDRPFEVIVAVDGSTDGSADALRALAVPFPLTVLEQPNRGAAAARNLGARRAVGEIVLFLDDDMEADPDLLREHDRLHRAGADAVLGHMPLHPGSARNAISDAVGVWSEERLARLSAPGAVLTLHDLLTGQLSVSATAFREIDGFDSSFTSGGSFGNEDVDFGHRLLREGYDIRFNPQAISYQRYEVTARQHLRQWRQAGSADVLFARKHPQEALDLFVLNGLRSRFARRVARPLARAPLWALLTGPVRTVAVLVGGRRGRVPSGIFFRARAVEYWRGVSLAGDIPRHTTLRVLAYHAIADLRGRGPLEPYGVPAEQFAGQLATLRRWGFHLVSSEEFVAYVEGRAGLPRRAVLLTFDDCYTDLVEAAAVLREEGTSALAFAVSGLVGRTNEWDRVHGGQPLELLDAAGLGRLREQGFEIGAHSRSHPMLPTLAPADAEAEIRGSVDDLEALGLGPVRFFAYPYGEHDAAVRDLAREAGLTASFAIDPGVMDGSTDRMQIPRVEILRSDSGLRLLAKVAFARQWGELAPLYRRSRERRRRVTRRAGRGLRRLVAVSSRAGRGAPPRVVLDGVLHHAEPTTGPDRELHG